MNEIVEQIKKTMDHNFFWSYLCFFDGKKQREDYSDFGVALEYAIDYSTNGLVERVVGNNGWDFYLNVDVKHKIPFAIGESKNTTCNSVIIKNFMGDASDQNSINYPQIYFVCQTKEKTKTKPASKILYAIDGKEVKRALEKEVDNKIKKYISEGKDPKDLKFSTMSINLSDCEKSIISVGDTNLKLKSEYKNAYQMKQELIFKGIADYCKKAVVI